MNHDALQYLGKPVHVPESEPFARAQAGAVHAYIMERDLLVIGPPEIFLEPLLPDRKPRLPRGRFGIGRRRQPPDQKTGAVRVRRKQVFDLVPLLQGNDIARREHLDLMKLELPGRSAVHQAAGIDQDKAGTG